MKQLMELREFSLGHLLIKRLIAVKNKAISNLPGIEQKQKTNP